MIPSPLGMVRKGLRSVATGNTQAGLGIQSPHLPNAFVRVGRFLYSSSLLFIGVTTYAAYVNETTDPGKGPRLVLPGRKKKNAPDRPDRTPAFATGANAGSGSGATVTGPGTTKSPITPSGRVANHPELKPGISAAVATILKQFPQLVITSTVSGTHAQNSYHYQHRAADLAGPSAYMNQAAQWIAAHLGSGLVEGIHNPGLSIKNGRPVPASFWGAQTWAGHTNHIHVAV